LRFFGMLAANAVGSLQGKKSPLQAIFGFHARSATGS
jgi:hypothetical protein